MVKIECWVAGMWVACGVFHNEKIAWISLGSDNKGYRTVDTETNEVLTEK